MVRVYIPQAGSDTNVFDAFRQNIQRARYFKRVLARVQPVVVTADRDAFAEGAPVHSRAAVRLCLTLMRLHSAPFSRFQNT